LLPLALASSADAFCGFYVAKADTRLYNEASRVVLVRDGDRTVLTMANDYRGELTEFALVVPVPTVLEREQLHVGEMAMIDHLDAFTAPRLVEYFDEDPCAIYARDEALQMRASKASPSAGSREAEASALGVTIEATYTVGEYDILILSAKESGGLVEWLTGSGYKIPRGAERVLGSYVKQNLKFFVARVNLGERAKLGYSFLRPIQIAYESPKFMLPIRLGTVNANGPQDLLVYALTRTGRVETTNYRTVRLPTDAEIPEFVENEFADFYKSMFSRLVDREHRRAVFLEYAWDMAWCDPCAADPLSRDELRNLGVFWLDEDMSPEGRRIMPPQQAQNVFVTRLHVRYDAEHFPDDLAFQETGDRSNFQGRYVMRHPWKGSASCEAARHYRAELERRREREAQTLAELTGWDIETIRRKMGVLEPVSTRKWYERLWGG
jgi:hypothetical protein